MSTALTSPAQSYPLVPSFQCLNPPNGYNAILDSSALTWKAIQVHGGLAAVCRAKKYAEPPWVKMPPQGKRYSKIGSLPYSPAIATGNDTLIPFTQGAFLVPQGYDGCIVSVVFEYTGSGFNEGSGDITWRIKINERYAKDYSVVQVQIGSLQTPYNINSGQILVQSGNLIQIFVNIPPAAIGNLNGGSLIGAVFGWTWPR